MEVFPIIACAASEVVVCRNSIENLGFGSGKCGACRLAPGGNSTMQSWWKPEVPGTKHPGLVQARKLAKLAQHVEEQQQKRLVDKSKQKILVKANRAEQQTERNLIHSTRNSGRSNKDGDHTALGEITLDTKLQTKRENPVVLLHELVKVGQDARRAGNWMGALVLRNKNGTGVVAMTESDFARLLKRVA